MRLKTWRAIDSIIARGAKRYRRERDLPRLLPQSFAEAELIGREPVDVVARLRQAIIKERALAAAGRRAYNLVRHMALTEALRAEEAAMQ